MQKLKIYVMKRDTTEQLIIKNEGLVYYTLDMLNCKYSDEAISVGYEALWRAIETYDKSRNIKFSTYAVTCIRNAIWDMFRAQKEVSDNEVFIEDLQQELGRCDATLEPAEPTERYLIVQEAVDEALKKLKGKKRQIAVIWIGRKMSATAIAQEVGCSQSYVSQVIGQVKNLVKKELVDAGYSLEPTIDSCNE